MYRASLGELTYDYQKVVFITRGSKMTQMVKSESPEQTNWSLERLIVWPAPKWDRCDFLPIIDLTSPPTDLNPPISQNSVHRRSQVHENDSERCLIPSPSSSPCPPTPPSESYIPPNAPPPLESPTPRSSRRSRGSELSSIPATNSSQCHTSLQTQHHRPRERIHQPVGSATVRHPTTGTRGTCFVQLCSWHNISSQIFACMCI